MFYVLCRDILNGNSLILTKNDTNTRVLVPVYFADMLTFRMGLLKKNMSMNFFNSKNELDHCFLSCQLSGALTLLGIIFFRAFFA